MRAQAEIIGLLLIMVLLVVGVGVYLMFATSSSMVEELQPDQELYLTSFTPILSETSICNQSMKDLALVVATGTTINPCQPRNPEEVFNTSLYHIINQSLNQSFTEGTYEFSITTETAGFDETVTYVSCDPNPLQVAPRSDVLQASIGATRGTVTFTLKLCVY